MKYYLGIDIGGTKTSANIKIPPLRYCAVSKWGVN